MKNLKFNLFFTFLVIVSSLLILSCSKEEEQTQENNITTNKTASRLASTSCDIVGSLNVSTGTYTYTYTGDSGNTNINWTITPSSAANILSGQGTSTITITFNSSCTMSAYGTGGSGGACEDIISITKSNGSGSDCSCTPVFANEFYNVPVSGGGNVENAIYFGNRTTCTFDWSTVSSVKIQIGGVFGVGSNSLSVPNINTMGQTGGMANNSNWTTTPSGFRNIKIRTHLNSSNVTPGFLRNNTLGPYGGWVTIYRNNGCPNIFLYLNDDSEFSFIN